MRGAIAVHIAAVAWSCGAFAAASAVAQSTAAVLEPVVVTVTRISQPLREAPAAISVVEQSDIQDGRATIGLDEPLNRVAGVVVQNSDNFAQDVRIQIRGFGTRAAFGIREIKVLVDGLPETMADGQTELDGFDLGAIEHIEVLRGAASSLYGNAAGGVIQLFTEDGPDTPWAHARLTGGSFGLQKYQVKGGGTAGNAHLFVSSSYLHLNGFRDHSGVERANLTGKLRYTVSEHTDVTFLFSGVDMPNADDAGGLTRAEVEIDRSQARRRNLQLNADKQVLQGRLGAVAHHRFDDSELSLSAYGLYRDFDTRQPFTPQGIVTFHRFSPGGGARYAYFAPVAGVGQKLTVGVDVQSQNDERSRFDNVNGDRGMLGVHQHERVISVGPYAREAVALRDDLEVSLGLRYDSVHFAVDVDTPPGGANSGARTFDAWSPGGGLRYSPLSWLSLFFDAGTAFQVPTTTELGRDQGAGFNPDVKPQTATSFEVGARNESERLRAGLAAFFIDITDELIPFQGASGRTIFRNAGRSRRYGLEIDWQAAVLPGVRWSSTASMINATFRDYHTASGTFDGNDEPGIPSWQLYEELVYRHYCGLFTALEGIVVGDYFVNDANTVRSKGYALFNLRGGYERAIGAWNVSTFVGLNNLTNTAYDGRVRLNANPDPGQPPTAGRFFEPAPGFNVYGGVTIRAGA